MKEKLMKIWKKKDHPITIIITYLLIFVFLMIIQPILDYYFQFGGDDFTHFISVLIVSSLTTLFIVKRYRDKVDDKVIYED
jgi:Na+/melibiose symporter-like transporter